MPKLFICIIIVLLCTSCETDNTPYSYLSDDDVSPDLVHLTINVDSDKSIFNYILQAPEMYIGWGDNSSSSEYVFKGNSNDMDTIRAISHQYALKGSYDITIKALQLRELNLSKTVNNSFTRLELVNCPFLKRLYCDNHEIRDLDLSQCRVLEELVCGSIRDTLSLSGLSELIWLRKFSLKGYLSDLLINLSNNDSLQTLEICKSNIINPQLSGLQTLRNVRIDSCSSLVNITIGTNLRLRELVIINNQKLTSDSLNAIFQLLPTVENQAARIVLSGNAGDSACDKSIAINKGWTFAENE